MYGKKRGNFGVLRGITGKDIKKRGNFLWFEGNYREKVLEKREKYG